jgi:hypothetical protein
MSVMDVDAGQIAVRTDTGLTLLSADGAVVREFPLSATAAALSGTRLAVRTADAVDVLDTRSGERLARVSAAADVRLADLQDDILVTASGDTVLLRRLSDERTISLRTAAAARAKLEPSGLFVAGGSRVTFTPMSELLRRFG